jgi:predicted transcriptional regulator
MDILKVIEEAVKPKQGNKPKYDESHVILALEIINKEQPIGRLSLMKKLNISEAPIKTLLKRLREIGIIKVDKVGGAELTEEGKNIINEWNKKIFISHTYLNSINWKSIEIILKNGRNILDKIAVISLRDSIIKEGADSALIAILTDKGIELPPKTDELSIGNLLKDIKDSCTFCTTNDLIVFIIPEDNYIAYKVALLLIRYESRISS